MPTGEIEASRLGIPNPAHLRLAGVTKHFGSVAAVSRVTLDIPRGAFATLLGPSGCGKTTLLRMIAGFYEPDEGSISLDNRRIDNMPAHQRGTAMVFQDYALFPHMRVFDNVAYGLRLAHVPKQELEQRVRETLEFVGIQALGERWPNQLSGGQQQRVALARALVIRPQVLLLDEPLSNLDANLRERLRWELRALQQRLNITFVYVTHDQAEALAMSDWIAVMSSGQVEQWGTPWEIYYRPDTAFMADFVGSANLPPATVVESAGERLAVDLDGQRIELGRAPVKAGEAQRRQNGSRVLLCIRPEMIEIGREASGEGEIHLAGQVNRRAFLGHVMRYWVQVGTREWIVDQQDPGASGQVFEGAVVLSVVRERVHVIPRKE